MNISNETRILCEKAEEALSEQFAHIDKVSRICTERVMDIFREERVNESMFAATTGYGYGDRGRDAID